MHAERSASRSGAPARPALVVLSTLFPSAAEPVAGVFIKERMFRVARHLPVVVVSPQPWFPLQSLLRSVRPHYRPPKPSFEKVDGIRIFRPRFFALPGMLRRLDGLFIALAALPTLRRLMHDGAADVLDVHFGYPDGYAGYLLSRWTGLPYAITLRGKEERLRTVAGIGPRMARALKHADLVIAVSAALRQVGLEMGAREEASIQVGNGIDIDKFRPIPQSEARLRLGLPREAKVLVSVGSLVERKGFHRVIECLPILMRTHPDLHLLVVGSAGPEGDYTTQLTALTRSLQLDARVHFLGSVSPTQLHVPLSAADVFVLATRYEGWANVLLEAMACRLPIVTTRVGGNAEVVSHPSLGLLVDFGDSPALLTAMDQALQREWDGDTIRAHAEANTWDGRVAQLISLFRRIRSPEATSIG